MTELFSKATSLGIEKYSKESTNFLLYGTAGFRDKATELTHVMYRMGLLAVLRSKLKKGCTVGLMITASHNPEEDNGVKLCDPDGTMLEKDWEELATKFVNTENEKVTDFLLEIVNSGSIQMNVLGNVFLARDTRSSSQGLSDAALDGVKVLNGQAKDFGLLTTPQLHFIVFCQNFCNYLDPTPEGYYKKLFAPFATLTADRESNCKKYKPELYVDGANGVGALKMEELLEHISFPQITIFNDGTKGILNYNCGADFVKVEQKPPEGCGLIIGKRYASFDGDADRLVYYYKDIDNAFHLLDGDKIATLIAKFLQELVVQTELTDLNITVVQTAYANGSSTKYLENELKIPVICVPTGVKHLHHEAMKHDIGIYFEANGHGTVVFSKQAKSVINRMAAYGGMNPACSAAVMLTWVMDLINETVGDAMSDLLLTEAILYQLDWDIDDWDAIYKDFPNRQLKIKVPDRRAIDTTDADRKCTKPKGLQEAIDLAVSKYDQARSFVRPSGTEDIIRVYAEAQTQDEADKLAEGISLLVKEFTTNL